MTPTRKPNTLAARLETVKAKKKPKQSSIVYIRMNNDLRKPLMAKLAADNLTLKDLVYAAAAEYLGIDISDLI